MTAIGMTLTATSVVLMPLLGKAKHNLADRLGSGATAGEGTQNVLCGIQAAAVLVGLAANADTGSWCWSGMGSRLSAPERRREVDADRVSFADRVLGLAPEHVSE